jgi:hypothetical protein
MSDPRLCPEHHGTQGLVAPWSPWTRVDHVFVLNRRNQSEPIAAVIAASSPLPSVCGTDRLFCHDPLHDVLDSDFERVVRRHRSPQRRQDAAPTACRTICSSVLPSGVSAYRRATHPAAARAVVRSPPHRLGGRRWDAHCRGGNARYSANAATSLAKRLGASHRGV